MCILRVIKVDLTLPFGLNELCMRKCDASSDLDLWANVTIIRHASWSFADALLYFVETSQNFKNEKKQEEKYSHELMAS